MKYCNLIGGEWVRGAEPSLNVNPPDTTDVIADYGLATEDDAYATSRRRASTSMCLSGQGALSYRPREQGEDAREFYTMRRARTSRPVSTFTLRSTT